MADLIDFVKLLTALVSLLTARPQNHYAPSATMGITATPSSRV